METIPQDWKEFLSALVSANTRFLLIGAHALAYHVEARLTEDLDVFVEPSLENAERVREALRAFGFADLLPSANELAEPNRVFMLGRKPWRIDILTGIDGVDFAEAWESRERVNFTASRSRSSDVPRSSKTSSRPADVKTGSTSSCSKKLTRAASSKTGCARRCLRALSRLTEVVRLARKSYQRIVVCVPDAHLFEPCVVL